MMSNIGNYLDELYPNPKCELNYNKDYELLIAIVLSAQTTDKRVNMITKVLYSKYNNLNKLKNASIDDLEDIIRPIGSFRKKALYVHDIAKKLDEEFNGIVPRDRDILMTFSGVGRKTANVFLSEYYNEATIGVDTHVSRVSKRLGIASKNDDVLKIEAKLMRFFPKKEWAKRHLQLVLFGRYHCTAFRPNCSNCKLINECKEKKKNIS